MQDPAAVEDASRAVETRLGRLAVLELAHVVAGYRAVRGEIDIDATLIGLRETGVTVTVPRVVGEELEFVQWDPAGGGTLGSFGIPEPARGVVVGVASHDVVLAPLVAFDRAGHRLGQGGGYYDRTMARRAGGRPLMIGVAHAFQEVESIPVEPWDVPLDAVVTECETIAFRPGVLDPVD